MLFGFETSIVQNTPTPLSHSQPQSHDIHHTPLPPQVRPEPLIPFDHYEAFLDCCHYGGGDAAAKDEASAPPSAAGGADAEAAAASTTTSDSPLDAGENAEVMDDAAATAAREPQTPPPTPDRAPHSQQGGEEGLLPPAVVVTVAMPPPDADSSDAGAGAGAAASGGQPSSPPPCTGTGAGGTTGAGAMAIALDRLSATLARLPAEQWARLQGLLTLLRRVAQAPSPDGASLHPPTVAALGAVLGPSLARPRGAAHLSLRHAREQPRLASLGATLIERGPELLLLQTEAEQEQGQQEAVGVGVGGSPVPSAARSPGIPSSPVAGAGGLGVALLLPPANLSSSPGHGGLSPARGKCGL